MNTAKDFILGILLGCAVFSTFGVISIASDIDRVVRHIAHKHSPTKKELLKSFWDDFAEANEVE